MSCNAPWDIDDNPDDDSMTVYASTLPLVSYQSSDIYWTVGVGIILVIIAYFGGVLNINSKPSKPDEKDDVDMNLAISNIPTQTDVEMDIDDIVQEEKIDDISFDEEIEVDEQTDTASIDKIEEETIDIDDGTASGRLSALRKEIEIDSDPSQEKEDINSRMDSFFKNR